MNFCQYPIKIVKISLILYSLFIIPVFALAQVERDGSYRYEWRVDPRTGNQYQVRVRAPAAPVQQPSSSATQRPTNKNSPQRPPLKTEEEVISQFIGAAADRLIEAGSRSDDIFLSALNEIANQCARRFADLKERMACGRSEAVQKVVPGSFLLLLDQRLIEIDSRIALLEKKQTELDSQKTPLNFLGGLFKPSSGLFPRNLYKDIDAIKIHLREVVAELEKVKKEIERLRDDFSSGALTNVQLEESVRSIIVALGNVAFEQDYIAIFYRPLLSAGDLASLESGIADARQFQVDLLKMSLQYADTILVNQIPEQITPAKINAQRREVENLRQQLERLQNNQNQP